MDQRYGWPQSMNGANKIKLLFICNLQQSSFVNFNSGFYECLILLNSQPSNRNSANDPTRKPRLSVAKDYFETAAELSFLGREKFLSVKLNLYP